MEREQLRQAYLDSELTVREAAEFEATLSEFERAELLAERRFQRGVAEALAREALCPDALWEKTRRSLGTNHGRRRIWRRLGQAAPLLAAASVALVLTMWVNALREERGVVIAAQTIDEIRAESEIPPGPEASEAYLAAHDIHVSFDASRRPRLVQLLHGLRFVGAKTNRFAGDEVVSLLIVCCRDPVKVVFARQNTDAAKKLAVAAATSADVQFFESMDEYVVAVVTHHAAPAILDIFDYE